MSGSTCLVGKTEKSTMMNEVNWMADWSIALLRYLKMAHTTAMHCSSMGGPNHNYGETGPDVSTVDSLHCMMRGLIEQLNEKFEFQYYQTKEGQAVWRNLELTFEELKKQGLGIIPIPTEGSLKTATPIKTPNEVDKGCFGSLVLEAMRVQEKMQTILDKFYDQKDPKFPNLQLQFKIMTADGSDVKIPDFDIDAIVKKEMMRRIDMSQKEREFEVNSKPKHKSKKCRGEHDDCECGKGNE